uniref:Uncharacterized protein n=1 Tax=Anguilla anguilla TaxID=7936 RepID=A0A0E9X6X7_ANGAN
MLNLYFILPYLTTYIFMLEFCQVYFLFLWKVVFSLAILLPLYLNFNLYIESFSLHFSISTLTLYCTVFILTTGTV